MVAGHICLDITPTFRNNKVEHLNSILSPGKLIQVGLADISTGGTVANAGLAMNFFGANVTLLAKVGDDPFGKVIEEKLTEHNASFHLIKDKHVATSYSVVIAIPGLDRIFLHHTGTNDTFYESDITDELLDGITHFHFGYPPLMRSMYEDNGDGLSKLFKRVKDRGCTTSLDMAAVDPGSDSGKADWHALLTKTLPYVDFFLPSIEETGYMLDRSRYLKWNELAEGNDITRILSVDEDISPMAGKLLELGAKIVVLKCGELGMYYKTGNVQQLEDVCKTRNLNPDEWCNQCGFEQSYLQENIISGTGAGDVSIAAFLTSMLNGASLHRSIQLAAAAGAYCISSPDALSGLEPLDVLSAHIDSGWAKRKPFADTVL